MSALKKKPVLQRMESQEIDDTDTLIEKKKIQKWKAVTAHALKNKTNFSATLKFVDVDGNDVELTVKADQPLLNNIWNCVSIDDDDTVIALNDFYYKIKFNTEQIIDYRKAKGNHIRVAEEARRQKHELQKQERSTMLAAVSLDHHAYSLKQKELMPPPPPVPTSTAGSPLPTASTGNIRETYQGDKSMMTASPAPSCSTRKRLHSSEEGPSPTTHTVYSRLDDEQSAQSKHREGEDDDDDVEESPAKTRRGWFGGLF